MGAESFKRFLYIVLIVVGLSGIFLIRGVSDGKTENDPMQSSLVPEREFIEMRKVDEGDKPRVWLLGDFKDARCGEIYRNVRQFCEDIQLTVAGEGRLDGSRAARQDLVICCDASLSRCADPAELESFVAGGGRVILAAGLAEGDSRLLPVLGIQEASPAEEAARMAQPALGLLPAAANDPRLLPGLGIQAAYRMKDLFLSPSAEPTETGTFIAGVGPGLRVSDIAKNAPRLLPAFGALAASRDPGLLPGAGIQTARFTEAVFPRRTQSASRKITTEDARSLIFERPLLPVQPEGIDYAGNSGSARIRVSDDAAVYLRDQESGVPILYTYNWRQGSVCLINGSFLTDRRSMGLLSGAIGALLPDFVYPVLGVKAVVLDSFPTSDVDELCRRLYGYSTEGFVQDVIWPAFQGISLRTETPFTVRFPAADDPMAETVGRLVQQFSGELTYAADNPEAWDAAEPQPAREPLESHTARRSREDGVFPAATSGTDLEDGALFDACSVLGAYGMISHVYDVDVLLTRDGETAAWDSDNNQLGLFESELLARAPWLEGRTLSQTGDDVRSYQEMDYGWTKNGGRIELECSRAAKGQAFFYHTGSRIAAAEGLTYQEIGNGYYLLRIQSSHGTITLEEGE